MKKLLAILFLLSFGITSYAQVNGDFRSGKSGDWETISIWQTYNGSSWVDATTAPESNSNVTIISKHTIHLLIAAAQYKVRGVKLIESGGKLLVSVNSNNFELKSGSFTVDGELIVSGDIKNNVAITGSGVVKATIYSGSATVFLIATADINSNGLPGKYVAGSTWIGGTSTDWYTASNWLGVAPVDGSDNSTLVYAISNAAGPIITNTTTGISSNSSL